MSEMVATPPASPTSPTNENELNKVVTPPANGAGIKKYDGDGVAFKAKLIGMEDLSIDRDEKVCLDSMFKLKAVVRARGEHKQRIQLNLTMSAVKVFDDTTKAQIASHEIERISFVVIDPRDTRAFGYIYNTSDDRHQFWAIKTERAAAATVLALKELFELAFEQFTNSEKGKEETPKITTPSVPDGSTQKTAQAPPISSPPPAIVPPTSQAPPSLIDGTIWGESSPPVIPQKSPPIDLLWGTDEPVVPLVQAPPKPVDPLADLFDDLSLTTPVSQPPPSTGTNNLLFDAFSTPAPSQPPVINPYGNFYSQPVQPNLLNATSPLFQQAQQQQQARPSTPTTTPLLLPQQPVPGVQQNLLNASPISPVAPPSVTSPFADIDIFGGFSASPAGKTTKESFFPSTPAAKTMQQLQMEKQP